MQQDVLLFIESFKDGFDDLVLGFGYLAWFVLIRSQCMQS